MSDSTITFIVLGATVAVRRLLEARATLMILFVVATLLVPVFCSF